MATFTSKGSEIHIWNFSIDATDGSKIVLNQKVNAVSIQCRTAVDLELREGGGDSAYFTIKSGTVFLLDLHATSLEPFHLKSGSGTVNVEIIGYIE